MKENFPYSDIIDLPHHQSPNRRHMSLYDRAAQFSAFAALSGYEEIIAETGRLTDDRIELPEHIKDELDRKFRLLQAIIDESIIPEMTITYFIPDKTKSGGRYETFTGVVKRIDTAFQRVIFFEKNKDLTGKIIEIGMIASAESEYFSNDI